VREPRQFLLFETRCSGHESRGERAGRDGHGEQGNQKCNQEGVQLVADAKLASDQQSWQMRELDEHCQAASTPHGQDAAVICQRRFWRIRLCPADSSIEQSALDFRTTRATTSNEGHEPRLQPIVVRPSRDSQISRCTSSLGTRILRAGESWRWVLRFALRSLIGPQNGSTRLSRRASITRSLVTSSRRSKSVTFNCSRHGRVQRAMLELFSTRPFAYEFT